MTHLTLNQITFIFQIIYDTLERIETAISFAKLNALHNSIVNPIIFSQEIKDIEEYIEPFALPFENKLENILKFERLIDVKSFQQGTEITFILELPLVEPTTYQYYELYPFPIKTNNTYMTIIPRTKYLATNGMNFLETNDKCIEFVNKDFICKNIIQTDVDNNTNCELEIIRHAKVTPSCNINQVNIKSPVVYKINNANYIAIIPESLIITETCNKLKNSKNLQPGSYVIELDTDCYIQLKNYKLKSKKALPILMNNIDIPEININFNLTQKEINFKDLNLMQVNTHKLQNLETLLDMQKNKINEINFQTITGNISISTIIIYLILSVIIIYFIVIKIVNPMITKYRYRKEKENNETSKEIKI